MSIARAFTTRRVKQSLRGHDSDATPQRSSTTKGGFGSIRNKISAPVELIHTTNMLSYNAPDIFPKTASSTTSSHKSDDDLSDSVPASIESPPTSPDIESPPKSVLSPEPNHLSCYFTMPGQPATPATPTTQIEAPVVPQRVASHTKKSYDSLIRQRSISRMSEQSQRTVSTKASFSFSRSSSASTNTSATSHVSSPPPHYSLKTRASGSLITPALSSFSIASPQSPSPQQQAQQRKDFSQSQHPFGPELAQVSEIAEEYGVKEQVHKADAEEQEMVAKGLVKFSAEDYLGEIHGLFTSLFGETKPMATAMWI
ncbi:hypothetical protein B0H67DRAFT_474265 [Lasiosphaeris hirsuta]|uniref:Uncharacterized protein n=1 Tax=Lasiosphaeris hirsuta TaxID=260670 RepID=A0AA40BAI3_9PEZI|nr:hypothetical protein B0H67DRAFT_474265 [Lasiosphaeris hirsuta]